MFIPPIKMIIRGMVYGIAIPTLWKMVMFNGKTHYFDWAIFQFAMFNFLEGNH